jgi:protein SCO1
MANNTTQPVSSLIGPKRTIIMVLVIFFVPIVIWLWMVRNVNVKCKPLMTVPCDVVNGDTIPCTVPPFSFRTQDGTTFTQDSLRNYYTVANFVFTTCPGICINLSEQFAKLQEDIKDSQDVKLISYTVDPETDSVPVLKAYAERYKAISGKWVFLTGPEADIVRVVKEGYKQPVMKTPKGIEKVTHSNMVVLIDKELRIRGFYNLIDKFEGKKEMKRLTDEINVLACEFRAKQRRDKAAAAS